eukprot:CAMPEP_0172746220 /NCGR_PEP_ID=MMETSP1074-20121228/139951_1 /TAXON_ID=2916 /ORGANISM="Ceratium fusus, Strain PA161109" /LENGTH=38 /DNA_ID= /DNA_START= /DNA_END= /DNA_ORIENTATION=
MPFQEARAADAVCERARNSHLSGNVGLYPVCGSTSRCW